MNIDQKLLGKAIRFFRKKAEMTQKQLGDELMFTENYVAGVERGKGNVTPYRLSRFAKCFGVPRNFLLVLATPKPQNDKPAASLLRKLQRAVRVIYEVEQRRRRQEAIAN